MAEETHRFKQMEGGEIRYRNSALPYDVFFRTGKSGGRDVITELRIVRPDGVTAGDLSRLRLGQLEAFVNTITTPARVMRQVAASAQFVQQLGAAYGDIEWHLKVPTERPYPDEFYKSVARSYLACLRIGGRPAPQLAEAWGVPRSTVHGWVKEARRRGMLPPGRKGKAG